MQRSQHTWMFDLAVFVVSCAVLGYLGWHGYYGPRSFDHRDKMKLAVKTAQKTLKATEERRDRLNERVGLLRASSIDPDMLDEMARQELGFAARRDLILITAPN